jgi:hypothetical protein
MNLFTQAFITLGQVLRRRPEASFGARNLRKIANLLFAFSFAIAPVNAASHRLIAQGPPAPPTFSPAYGVYPSSTFVTLSAPSGTIYYTLDGSVPSATNGTVYGGPLQTPQSEQINAVVIVSGVSSAVATAWYSYDTNAFSIPTANTTPSANLLLWLRSDFGPVVSGGNISTWGDISLSENTATAVSPTQPTLQANSVDGLPAATFTPGSNGQFLSIPSAVSNFSSGLTAFVVARPSTLTSGAQLFSIGSGTLASSVGISENSSFQPTFSVYNSGGTATTLTGTSAFPTNQFQLYEVIQSGTSATMYVNGSQVAQNTAMNSLPTSSSSTSSFVGKSTAGGSYFTGQIAEVLLYSTALTSPQKSYVESYLIQKYQLGLPMQAPVISVPAGTLTGPTMVALSAPAAETIHVTLDGTTPTAMSPVYTGPINIYYSQTLNAIAINGTNQSTVSSAAYVLNPLLYPAPSTGGVPLQLNLTLPSTAIP